MFVALQDQDPLLQAYLRSNNEPAYSVNTVCRPGCRQSSQQDQVRSAKSSLQGNLHLLHDAVQSLPEAPYNGSFQKSSPKMPNRPVRPRVCCLLLHPPEGLTSARHTSPGCRVLQLLLYNSVSC